MMVPDEKERLRRWRLVLGKASGAGLGDAGSGSGLQLGGSDLGMDSVLEALYDGERSAGLGKSLPNVTRWLGDIRTYFPTAAVQVMQKDALERLNLTQMLLEPEMLEMVEPDVHLVANLMSLSKVIPEKTRDTARQVVRKVVDELERRLANGLIQAVRGSLNRATRTYRPRPNEINWDRTIRANLKNYLPDRGTIIAERLIGHGHKRSSLRDIVLCVDQSRPAQTILVLITDLYEGGNAKEMLRRAGELKASGAQVICLLALSDRGASGFDQRNAALLASMDIPAFACTPELFPDLMAAAIQRQDLAQWAARNDIVAVREEA